MFTRRVTDRGASLAAMTGPIDRDGPPPARRGGAVKHAGDDTRSAEVLRIRRKRRRHPLATASLAGFRVSHAAMADAGILLENPCLSLYCLDEPGQRASFVETPAGVDLTREPLLYLAQHRHAIRLLAVPYATLDAMADAASDRAPPLRLVYSCGRSGSTLLSRMFALAEGCVSLSEPDAFTQMVFMDLAPDDIVRRVRTLVWALCRPEGKMAPHYIVKFRSMCVEHAELMHRAFPDARSLFLYRNAFDYVASSMRAFRHPAPVWNLLERSRRWPVVRTLVESVIRRYFEHLARMAPMAGQYTPNQIVQMGLPGLLALAWLSSLHRYLELREAGRSIAAVVYDDLVTHPASMWKGIVTHFGMESSAAGNALAALSEDSQQGTVLGVDRRASWTMGDEERSVILGVLGRHPVLRSPEVRVPGTLSP